MQLKISGTRDALHPSEVVVVVNTTNGTESLVVDKKSLQGEFLEIGHPIGTKDNNVLVELPRETYSGAWRVWVGQSDVRDRAA